MIENVSRFFIIIFFFLLVAQPWVKKEGRYSVSAFGTFTLTKWAATRGNESSTRRKGRNPQTGEAIKIKASKRKSKMGKNKIEYEKSSGNVFQDLGFPNPEMEQLKSALSFEIFNILKQQKLTQAQAAKILGIDQPQVSRLKNADFTRFSVERLFGFLNRLGRHVDIYLNRAEEEIPHQRVVHA